MGRKSQVKAIACRKRTPANNRNKASSSNPSDKSISNHDRLCAGCFSRSIHPQTSSEMFGVWWNPVAYRTGGTKGDDDRYQLKVERLNPSLECSIQCCLRKATP